MRNFWRAIGWSVIAVTVVWTAPLAAVADEAGSAQVETSQADEEFVPPRKVLEQKQQKKEQQRARQAERSADAKLKRAARKEARGNQDQAAMPRVLWWNDPEIVKELGLGEGLRKQFDADLAKANAEELDRKALPGSIKAYRDALEQGDWPAAKRALARRVEIVSQPLETQSNLQIKVLAALSDAQREKLRDGYKSVFLSKWVPRSVWGKKEPGGGQRTRPSAQNKP